MPQNNLYTKEKFVAKAIKKHGKGKYLYVNTEYVNGTTKVLITCVSCNKDFPQIPKSHLQGQGCPKCAHLNHRLTTKHFIEKSKKLFEHHAYDYTETVYVDTHTPLKITCNNHGDFHVTPNKHLSNQQYCPICTKFNAYPAKTTEEFIQQSQMIHPDKFDYLNTKYKSCHEPIVITCKIHENFETSPSVHLRGDGGCKCCQRDKIRLTLTKTNEEYINEAQLFHNYKYDYTQTVYTGAINLITIICPVHGLFTQVADVHLRSGCYDCGRKSMCEKRLMSFEEFMKKVFVVHTEDVLSKYDFSETRVHRQKDPISIKCIKHGVFTTSPDNFIHGHGCSKCGWESTSNQQRYTTDKYKIIALDIHGENRFDYTDVVYTNMKSIISLRCIKHNHKFDTVAELHITAPVTGGCCHCRKFITKTSKMCDNWLNDAEKKSGYIFQREWNIPYTKYIADAYCTETNTIYEFQGDFWHGNPNLYDSNAINPVKKCTFRELYNKTSVKTNVIKGLGYNFIEIWEYDWNIFIKNINGKS